MAHYFSPSKVGFYDSDIMAPPEDAVPITFDELDALMAAQAGGKLIQAGKDGRPVAIDPPAETPKPRSVLGSALRDVLTVEETTRLLAALGKVSIGTRDWWMGSYRFDISENSIKIVRLSGIAAIDLKSWFDRSCSL